MFAYDALNKGIAAMRDFAAKSGNGDASSTTGDTMNSVGSIDSDVTGDTGARDATATQSHNLRDTSSDADNAHSTNSTDAADGADTANSITHSTGAAGDSTTGGSPTLSPGGTERSRHALTHHSCPNSSLRRPRKTSSTMPCSSCGTI